MLMGTEPIFSGAFAVMVLNEPLACAISLGGSVIVAVTSMGICIESKKTYPKPTGL